MAAADNYLQAVCESLRIVVVSGGGGAGFPAVKFFLCSLYSENGLAWPWEAGSGKYDAQPSVSKSAWTGASESELAD